MNVLDLRQELSSYHQFDGENYIGPAKFEGTAEAIQLLKEIEEGMSCHFASFPPNATSWWTSSETF